MGEDGGGHAQGAPLRAGQGGMAVHVCDGRIQPGSPAEAAGGGRMTPEIRPERAGWAEKSMKLARFRRRPSSRAKKLQCSMVAFQQSVGKHLR